MANKKIQLPNNQSTSLDDQNDSIWDLLLIIARQIKLILITPTIICILTIINVQFLIEPSYKSTVKIMSSSGSGNISQTADLAAQFGISIPNFQDRTQWVYSDILQSRTMALNMLKLRFDTNRYGPQKSLLQILTFDYNEAEFDSDRLEILAVKKLLSMIEINEDKRTRIFTVTLTASEPHFASDLNKALIEELDIYQQEYNQKQTSETRRFIEGRIISVEKELKTAEEALKDFRGSNRRIENSPALLLEEQRFAREVSVLTGVFTTLKQQLENTKIAEVQESNFVILLDPPNTPIVPSAPKKKQIVILAGLLGIGLGIGLGFLKEYAEKSDNIVKDKRKQIMSLFINNIKDLLSFKSKK